MPAYAAPTQKYGQPQIQAFLPPWLRQFQGKQPTPFAKGLESGIKDLADLFARPGGFSPNLSEAIAPRVAMEAEAIERNTSGSMAEAAGAAARSGTGSSGIAQAVQRALEASGSREKAASLRTAQMDSAQLRRQDLEKMLQTLQMLIETTMQGRKMLAKQKEFEHQLSQDRYGRIVGGISAIGGAFA
mgnify:FL=1